MVVIVVGAGVLRLADLGNRPMHCDEAVHADKFRLLLEHEHYAYNPYEYHGPSLNFLTLPIARLVGAEKLTQITETHLRLLPAIFGIILVALVWMIRDELGHAAALGAALLTAVSPAMVFYSRYYIQEMLLVCFTFAAMVVLWRWARNVASDRTEESRRRLRSALWLVLLGLCIGMMHASKETCVIALFSMAVAAGLTIPALRRIGIRQSLLPGLLVLATAAIVSALFFSSFLKNPPGIVDSFSTYFVYLGRASGDGSVGRHVYPWHYYFRILFCWHRDGGLPWTEASIGVLALVGLAAAVLGKGLRPAGLPMARFFAVYTLLMTGIYTVLPYKTPWCALGFLHGMILLAGVGMAVVLRAAPGYAMKAVVIGLLVAAIGHLGWQAWRASFVAYEDPGNPYVYAHTTSDVLRLVERVEQIAAVHPDEKAMHVQAICPDDDYWPLPWYLRGFSQVGWFGRVPDGPAAPLIIIQPKMEPALLKYLYEKQPPGQRYLYVPAARDDEEESDWQLRPNVPLQVYVRWRLWEAYRAQVQSAED